MPLRRLNPLAPSGKMNRRITFYSPGVRDSAAGTTGSPQAKFNTWASFEALIGAELDKAQQIAQKSSHLVKIPYQLDVDENMTIQYLDGGDPRTFQIEHIEDADEQRWQLKIYCFEVGQSAGSEL